MREGLAQRYRVGNYRFVPLVREELGLLCSLDILFLRSDPHGLIQSADIDSRVKTIFDALKTPQDTGQLGRNHQRPNADEDPFYCLLEDDKLITHMSVSTDMLLDPTRPDLTKNQTKNDARLMIDVKIRPYVVTYGNIGFGG
jgi:hypothetical protein